MHICFESMALFSRCSFLLMLLFFSRLARLLGSTDFAHLSQQLAVRFLRLTFITLGTGSVIYAIRCLSKLRTKELLLKQCLEQRQNVEHLLVTCTKTDEQLKKQIADLHAEYRQDCHVYSQLEEEEQQLHDAMQTFLNDRQVRHSTNETNLEKTPDDHRPISGRHSQSCLLSNSQTLLTLNVINPMPTLEARKVNITRIIPRREERHSRSKSLFPRALWSKTKKTKKFHSRGDGDTSSSSVVKSINPLWPSTLSLLNPIIWSISQSWPLTKYEEYTLNVCIGEGSCSRWMLDYHIDLFARLCVFFSRSRRRRQGGEEEEEESSFVRGLEYKSQAHRRNINQYMNEHMHWSPWLHASSRCNETWETLVLSDDCRLLLKYLDHWTEELHHPVY